MRIRYLSSDVCSSDVYVYDIGFIQDSPSWGVAFGATHRKQGAAYDRVIGEEIRTTYGADLEIFVEKRIGGNFTIRAVGSNLLNGAKRETFNKFDNLADQQARDSDEYELEREKAGPVFHLMARCASCSFETGGAQRSE